MPYLSVELTWPENSQTKEQWLLEFKRVPAGSELHVFVTFGHETTDGPIKTAQTENTYGQVVLPIFVNMGGIIWANGHICKPCGEYATGGGRADKFATGHLKFA